MGDPRQVRVAFDNANAFLSPVLSRGIVTQFYQGKGFGRYIHSIYEDAGADDSIKGRAVISQSLDTLSQIHTAFTTPWKIMISIDSTCWRGRGSSLGGCKETSAAACIAGLGFPGGDLSISFIRRLIHCKRDKGTVPASSKPHDELLLRQIMGVLLNIMSDSTPRHPTRHKSRILSDIISGTAELSFQPKCFFVDGPRKI
ncbi:uncharacterized protein N7469_003257 [Penicillium citrinum]|uniref:Uncharacterized protein n=1 Tax=Penicillium citrinum TaxID=5077 RepID=A0A9W9PBX1_PENCI|nr:uncharacterized protein N7469_003257 [Penicillium citrinum]KAJ5241666.1 hypothetical protein N7469_003257 [Penicillium citrinum]